MGKHEPRGELQLFLILYRTQLLNKPIKNPVYRPDTLRYHGYLAEFGYAKSRVGLTFTAGRHNWLISQLGKTFEFEK